VRARLAEIGPVVDFPDEAASNQPYGTPDVVAQRLAEYAGPGVDEVITVVPAPYEAETIERLISEVRPHALLSWRYRGEQRVSAARSRYPESEARLSLAHEWPWALTLRRADRGSAADPRGDG
jgi:hypothetical protein